MLTVNELWDRQRLPALLTVINDTLEPGDLGLIILLRSRLYLPMVHIVSVAYDTRIASVSPVETIDH